MQRLPAFNVNFKGYLVAIIIWHLFWLTKEGYADQTQAHKELDDSHDGHEAKGAFLSESIVVDLYMNG